MRYREDFRALSTQDEKIIVWQSASKYRQYIGEVARENASSHHIALPHLFRLSRLDPLRPNWMGWDGMDSCRVALLVCLPITLIVERQRPIMLSGRGPA